jgi:hypothetical protein
MISYRSEQLGVVHHLRGPLPVGMDAMDLTSLDARRNIISQSDLPTSGVYNQPHSSDVIVDDDDRTIRLTVPLNQVKSDE